MSSISKVETQMSKFNELKEKVVGNFSTIASPDRNYNLSNLPKISFTPDTSNIFWRDAPTRTRQSTHDGKPNMEIVLSSSDIEARANRLLPVGKNILENVILKLESLTMSRNTREGRLAVASAVLTLEAITSSYNRSKPTQDEYDNLFKFLKKLGYPASLGRKNS